MGDSGSCGISDHDIRKTCGSLEQFILGRLKDAGAPISGTFLLKPEPGYTFIRDHDYHSESYLFTWRPTNAN